MLTISIAVFGITIVNWHFDFIAEIAKKSRDVAALLNVELQKILAVPLEWITSYSFIKLDVKIGADSTILALDSRAATPVAPGTIQTRSVHPDVIPAISSPAPGDLDSMNDWETPNTAPHDAPSLSDGPLGGND